MTEQQKTQISLQDISMMVLIIDTVVKRGAIEGNEMAAVGGLRNKLESFVKENTPKEDQPQEEKTEE